MLVYDVYKIVALSKKDISTAKFFLWLNEGISELVNSYANAEDSGTYTDLQEEMKLDVKFKNALADYILAMAATDSDMYNKYMSAYLNAAMNASFAAGKGKRHRIPVPRFR